MPQDVISEEVRLSVRTLRAESSTDTAETTALAMVEGAARGYRDITGDGGRVALQRLLDAIGCDAHAAVRALSE